MRSRSSSNAIFYPLYCDFFFTFFVLFLSLHRTLFFYTGRKLLLLLVTLLCRNPGYSLSSVCLVGTFLFVFYQETEHFEGLVRANIPSAQGLLHNGFVYSVFASASRPQYTQTALSCASLRRRVFGCADCLPLTTPVDSRTAATGRLCSWLFFRCSFSTRAAACLLRYRRHHDPTTGSSSCCTLDLSFSLFT